METHVNSSGQSLASSAQGHPSVRAESQVAGPTTTIVMPDGRQRIPLGSGVITGFLGQGGMANVYEIWNGRLEVYRAVKLINPNCSRDARERFETEMKISAKLHHPNIIEIYGVGTWNGLPYIEMEKLDGVTLDTLIRERGALPPAVVTAIGIMVGRALKYAHSQEYALYGSTYKGVIHRDLKPSNIMICRTGTVKLMDFGIASPAEASFHTVAGTVLGTLQYLPPEQLECKRLDVTSDIYSLGVSLYEALTGTMAFPEPSVHKLMLDKLKGRYKPLEQYRLKIPSRLRRLIHRCMEQDPRRRVPNASALLAELSRIHERLTSETPEQVMRRLLQTPAGERVVVATRPVWPMRVALAGSAGLLTGLVVWWFIPEQKPAAAPSATQPISVVQEEPPVTATSSPSSPDTPPSSGSPPILSSVASRPAKAAARPVASVVPPSQTPVQRSPTVLEWAMEKHGTSDVMELIRRELRAGAYSSTLALFEYLPSEKRESVEAQLLRLRALAAAGRTAEFREALETREIADGEYWLMRARVDTEQGRTAAALEALRRADAVSRALMDYDEYKRESAYWRARSASALFDQNPSDESYKRALDAWYELRVAVRATPEHPYYGLAQAETQRIGHKYRQTTEGRQ